MRLPVACAREALRERRIDAAPLSRVLRLQTGFSAGRRRRGSTICRTVRPCARQMLDIAPASPPPRSGSGPGVPVTRSARGSLCQARACRPAFTPKASYQASTFLTTPFDPELLRSVRDQTPVADGPRPVDFCAGLGEAKKKRWSPVSPSMTAARLAQSNHDRRQGQSDPHQRSRRCSRPSSDHRSHAFREGLAGVPYLPTELLRLVL